jgi:hypothetical protein
MTHCWPNWPPPHLKLWHSTSELFVVILHFVPSHIAYAATTPVARLPPLRRDKLAEAKQATQPPAEK